MKILHVISGLKRGGAETQLFRICQFDRDNVHVVVSLSNKEGYGDILEKINVSVYALNFSSGKINISGLFKLLKTDWIAYPTHLSSFLVLIITDTGSLVINNHFIFKIFI